MKFNLKYLKKNKWLVISLFFVILVLVSVYYYYSNDCIEGAENIVPNFSVNDKFKTPTDASQIAINMFIDSTENCNVNGDCVKCAQLLVNKLNDANKIDKTLLYNLQKWSPTLYNSITDYMKPNADKSIGKSSQLITNTVTVATSKDNSKYNKRFNAAQIATFQPSNCRQDKTATPAAKPATPAATPAAKPATPAATPAKK